MALRSADVTIADENRDKGRTYRITEMPAARAEKWAFRVAALLARAGVDLPNFNPSDGWRAMAAAGIQALPLIDMDAAEPLLDQMMSCVQYLQPTGMPRTLMEGDIEEIATRIKLRAEVFNIHTGFYMAAVGPTSTSETSAASNSSTIQTSPAASEPSFLPARPR